MTREEGVCLRGTRGLIHWRTHAPRVISYEPHLKMTYTPDCLWPGPVGTVPDQALYATEELSYADVNCFQCLAVSHGRTL